MTPIDALLHGCYTKAPKRIRGLLAYSTFCLQSARFDLWACLDSNQGPLPYQFRSVLPPPRPARPAGPENGLDRAKTPGPERAAFPARPVHPSGLQYGCSRLGAGAAFSDAARWPCLCGTKLPRRQGPWQSEDGTRERAL